MKTINTIQELCAIVNNSIHLRNAIVIENVNVNFDIDFRMVLKECGICNFENDDTICVVEKTVRLFNVTTTRLSFENIEFYNKVYIGGNNDNNITNLYFCSSKFLAKERYSISMDICDSLELSDCYSHSNIRVSSNKPTKKIQIEDLDCDKNLEFRNLKLTESIDDNFEMSSNFNMDSFIENNEINEIISNELNKMEEIDRKVFVLFYFNGKKSKEIAELLNLTEFNVSTKLHRIRKKLKDVLKSRGYSYGK